VDDREKMSVGDGVRQIGDTSRIGMIDRIFD
jgi:hypothetical protein